MKRRIRLDRLNAAERLAALPAPAKRRIREALRNLGEDPTGIAHGIEVKELRPTHVAPRAFRARVGDWRIVFVLTERELSVMRIFPRSEGYRWMERDGPPR